MCQKSKIFECVETFRFECVDLRSNEYFGRMCKIPSDFECGDLRSNGV